MDNIESNDLSAYTDYRYNYQEEDISDLQSTINQIDKPTNLPAFDSEELMDWNNLAELSDLFDLSDSFEILDLFGLLESGNRRDLLHFEHSAWPFHFPSFA